MYIRPHLQAVNTDWRLLERMRDIIEELTGKRPTIIVSNKGNETQKKAWRAAIHTQWEILIVLSALLPFLVSKQRQAELVLEFCMRKYSRSKKRWYEHADLDQAAYWECRALNHRGTKPPPTASSLRLVKEA